MTKKPQTSATAVVTQGPIPERGPMTSAQRPLNAIAIVTSFGIRFLVAGSAFWLLDQAGIKMLSGVFAIFFSGMALPLVIVPEPLRSIALALPWASYLQTPADIWLGKDTGAEILAALGVLFIVVDVLPFFAGSDDRPLWLNLACLLLPLGLVVAVWSALAQGRREQKDALRALQDARRR